MGAVLKYFDDLGKDKATVAEHTDKKYMPIIDTEFHGRFGQHQNGLMERLIFIKP